MNYKILEAHILFAKSPAPGIPPVSDRGYITVAVAIQSNPLDEPLTRWKAYTMNLNTVDETDFERVASCGSKLRPTVAAELFPELERRFHYEF